jgi:hypothetical protein
MTTKNVSQAVYYNVFWKNKAKRNGKHIVIGIFTGLDEAIKLIQSTCNHSGKDEFTVFEVRVGEQIKLIIDGNLKNYAS